MSKVDGLIRLYCDYCEDATLIGYIDYQPTEELLNIVGAQFCCPDCYKKRGDDD